MKPGIFAGGRADLNSELAVQVAVTIVELDREHVGNDIIREQEHVVVGDAADHVVVKYQTVLVADDDGDVLQFVRHGKHKRVTVVTQYGQERGNVLWFWMIWISISNIIKTKFNYSWGIINKIPPPKSDWQEL